MEPKKHEGIEFSAGAPGGIWAKVSGREAWMLIAVVLVAAVTALLVTITLEMQQRKTEHIGLSLGQVDLKAAVNKVADAQIETTYILTLSQSDREKLKLQMPPSLWRRLRGDQPGAN